MTPSSIEETREQKYDRNAELRAFDETMAGVKGLVNSGITEVPRIFIQPRDHLQENKNKCDGDKGTLPEFPIIDMDGLGGCCTRRREIIDKMRDASEKWGFFQVINHGIPSNVMEEVIKGVGRFHDQDDELRKRWYTRDMTKKVVYYSNIDLFFSGAANWKDTLFCVMAPNAPAPEDLPNVCSEIMIKYSEEVMKLGCMLFELLSEGLGLDRNYLKDIDCAEGLSLICHYYPECPQPELVIGTTEHTDSSFITILLQDLLGGLQIVHQNCWIDVPPTPGALVINIGNFLQLISNDKFKSVEHRVLANRVGPRISVASFFTPGSRPTGKVYGPIEQLVSEENEPKYRGTTIKEFLEYYKNNGLDAASPLLHFKL